MASTIFDNIGDHDFMSTGNILIDALAVAIDKRVAGIGQYLDKRFLQSKSFTNTS